ncbi:MAG: ABC transporter ATP-binding protein [Verrucomicrobia bacterium]|nr:ABC transporter ATP-binding protein [Verrucomicrobiota bacterium]
MTHLLESEVPSRLFDRKLLRRLLVYMKPYTGQMVVALLLSIPVTLLMNYLPLLAKQAVDDVLTVDAATLSAADKIARLNHLGLLFLGMSAVAMVFRFAQGYVMSWVGQKILFDLRADIFSKIMRLPLRYFDRNPVGRLMTRIGSDVDAMQRLLTDGLIGLAGDLITIIGILGFMIYLSPQLAAILLVLLPVLFTSLVYLNVKVRKAHREVRRRQSALNSFLQEMLTGMTTIQLFNREGHTRTRFDDYSRSLRDANLYSVKWFSLSFPVTEIQNALTLSLVLVVGGFSLLSDEPTMTLGVLIAYLAYLRDFFRPLEDLSEKSNVLQSAMASSERVFGLMDVDEELRDPVRPTPIGTFRGAIQFKDVRFAYNEPTWILEDLNVTIHPGESVAIVGATGSGKSSLISLIARFYDVQRGAVLVDGHNVKDYRQSELRKRIGIVLQDPFVFSGTLADNIGLFNPEVSREQIMNAARYVNAHTFIENRPGGYDAVVQERGAGLSTGQKQLLALARVIAQHADILLILDEATANVDTETEQLIQDALKKVMQGRTSIIIAHRLSTIRDVDRILVMRQGRIVEQGSHPDLLSQNGYYRKLYDLLSHSPVR